VRFKSTPVPKRRLIRHLVKVGAAAALIVAVLNDVIAAVAASVLHISSEFKPLQLGAVSLFSIGGVTVAVCAYALVAWWSRRPMRIYVPLALVTLGASWLADLGLYVAKPFPDATGAGVLVLASLHVVAALVTVLFLNAWAANVPESARDADTPAAALGGA
jgi:hypothetical protein